MLLISGLMSAPELRLLQFSPGRPASCCRGTCQHCMLSRKHQQCFAHAGHAPRRCHYASSCLTLLCFQPEECMQALQGRS